MVIATWTGYFRDGNGVIHIESLSITAYSYDNAVVQAAICVGAIESSYGWLLISDSIVVSNTLN